MLQLIYSPYFRTVLNLGVVQAKKYVDSKIEEQVILKVQKLVEDEINRFFKAVWHRSKIYFLLILINLLSIAVLFTYKNFYFSLACASFTLIFFLRSIYIHIQGMRQIFKYIENFEPHLKDLIETELKSAKAENVKNKVALLINSKRSEDYYNLVLDQVIKCAANWLKNNKSLLYVRFGFYILSSVLFTLSLREAISVLYY